VSPRRSAFRALDESDAENLRLLLHARDAMIGVEMDLARARARSRLSEEFRRALKPDPRLRTMEAYLLEKRADGLRREANAVGAARWIHARLIRATARFFAR
jgi:hypothetical protein